MTIIDYSYTQENDQIYASETHRVTVASGAATAMAAAALTAAGVAIGATKYASTVKCYRRSVRHVEGIIWDVELNWRTEQFDDLIMNAASGTVIDKGFSAFSDRVLRDRSPTGSAYVVNNWRVSWTKWEPQAQAWWEKVHDSYPHANIITYVGSVNSATWNGYAAALWRCNAITTQTVRTDSGSRYLARYEFTYSADGHNLTTFRDTFNSRTLTSITAATLSSGLISLYKTANFATLGLSL